MLPVPSNTGEPRPRPPLFAWSVPSRGRNLPVKPRLLPDGSEPGRPTRAARAARRAQQGRPASLTGERRRTGGAGGAGSTGCEGHSLKAQRGFVLHFLPVGTLGRRLRHHPSSFCGVLTTPQPPSREAFYGVTSPPAPRPRAHLPSSFRWGLRAARSREEPWLVPSTERPPSVLL